MKQGGSNKNSRSKRSLMIINLVETPAGYSIIEGTETFNKNPNAQGPSNPVVAFNTTQTIVKQQKMVVKQNNLLLLKAPTNFQNSIQSTFVSKIDKPLKTPSWAKQFADWFSLSDMHPIQLNQVKVWTMEDHPEITKEQILDSPIFTELVDKYRKQRNIIIQVYGEKYGPTHKYMSASVIRRYICDDAYWLMRIHVFLNSEGIINNKHINLDNEEFRPTEILKKNLAQNSYEPITLKSFKDYPLKKYPEKGYLNEKNLILKKITNNIRPYCDFCGIHCSIVWFQHLRTMDPKQISTIMKNVNSKNPPLSEKEYEIILCTKCYCNGSFPLLLTHHDFRKVSINDKLEPDRKKKSSKNKRKEEKRKRKQKQMMEQNEQEREDEEKNAEGEGSGQAKNGENEECQPKKDKENKEKDKQEEEEEDVSVPVVKSGKKRNRIYTNEAMRLTQSYTSPSHNNIILNNANGTNNENGNNGDKNSQPSAQSAENASRINEIIGQIISKIAKPKEWEEEQIFHLLMLIGLNGDNWDKIHQEMVKSGYCYDCTSQDLIEKFVDLSHSISTINEQPSHKQFATANRNTHKSTFLTKMTQKKMDKAVELAPIIPSLTQNQQKQKTEKKQKWTMLLNKLATLHISRIEQKIKLTQSLQAISVEMARFSNQISKQIQEQ